MIFQKRNQWCFRDSEGKLHKFDSELAAKSAFGPVPQEAPVKSWLEDDDGEEEEKF